MTGKGDMLRPSIESQKPGEHQNCSEMARSIGREAMYHIPNTREEDAIIRRRETLIHTDLTSDPDAAEIAKVSQRQLFQLLETEPHGLTLDDIQGTQPEPVESPVGLPKYRDSKTP